MGKKQQTQGKIGEQAAYRELTRFGVCNLQEMPVEKVMVRGRLQHKKKVMGDLRGELDNGISVLVEVKTTMNKERIDWGVFTGAHQPKNLSKHKGLSLLVWVCEGDWSRDIYVLDWRQLLRFGFRGGTVQNKGKGISQEAAAILALTEHEISFLSKQDGFHISNDIVAPF